MKLLPTEIREVVIVEPTVFSDDRGWFMETYNEPRFHAALQALGLTLPRPFVQDNHSSSRRGVLRGLHYQLPPHAQGKLVRVTQGAAYDVAVDIRKTSPTFGCWVGAELSPANGRQMWIPEGFAHGFLALEDNTHFLYKTTDVYARECERSIAWNDAALGIAWPRVAGGEPLLAPKDAAAPRLADAETF
jgi:dTDP-4-dehydrorhamnose 3,5-epimerase